LWILLYDALKRSQLTKIEFELPENRDNRDGFTDDYLFLPLM